MRSDKVDTIRNAHAEQDIEVDASKQDWIGKIEIGPRNARKLRSAQKCQKIEIGPRQYVARKFLQKNFEDSEGEIFDEGSSRLRSFVMSACKKSRFDSAAILAGTAVCPICLCV